MTDKPQDNLLNKSISRREMLRMAGVGGVGILLGAGGLAAVSAGNGLLKQHDAGSPATSTPTEEIVSFYGKQQAGIVTPMQDFLCFGSFDLTTSNLSDVRNLFKKWTNAAANLCAGQPVGAEDDNQHLPPVDTGEAIGLTPMKTSITFGVGPSFFDQRFGLAEKRPSALVDLPSFAADELVPEWCGGDICVQVCANDPQVALHALRNLARIARGKAALRWVQEGFQRTGGSDPQNSTPRNLLGFKDGTGNPDVSNPEVAKEVVWVQPADGPAWMSNGSYLVARRIRMRIEVWDRSTLKDQEVTFGRHRDSGAPLGLPNEFDEPDFSKKDANGDPLIPMNAHIRLARHDGKTKMLRRSYSYSSGIDLKTGQLDAGLMFICFQRDPRSQFIPIQATLAQMDGLNEYIVHVGSAIFACLPGALEGGYIGETLFG